MHVGAMPADCVIVSLTHLIGSRLTPDSSEHQHLIVFHDVVRKMHEYFTPVCVFFYFISRRYF